MNETKHTPGPWHTGGTSFPGTDRARMNVWSPTPKGMQSGDIIAANCKPADARLIAAAPELLDALRVVASDGWVDLPISEQDRWLKLSTKAIAKAEGK